MSFTPAVFYKDPMAALAWLEKAFGFETTMLPRLLEILKQRGFKLITLQEAESDAAYESDPDIVLNEGGTLLEQMVVAKHLAMPAHAPVPIPELESMCQ